MGNTIINMPSLQRNKLETISKIILLKQLTGVNFLQQLIGDNFIDHPPPEVGHVVLRECNGPPPGEVLRELASKHAAVGAIHLLRDVL